MAAQLQRQISGAKNDVMGAGFKLGVGGRARCRRGQLELKTA